MSVASWDREAPAASAVEGLCRWICAEQLLCQHRRTSVEQHCVQANRKRCAPHCARNGMLRFKLALYSFVSVLAGKQVDDPLRRLLQSAPASQSYAERNCIAMTLVGKRRPFVSDAALLWSIAPAPS